MLKKQRTDDAKERQKANDKEKQMTRKEDATVSGITTTANIPNPAVTAMGPSPFLDKRRKKDKSIVNASIYHLLNYLFSPINMKGAQNIGCAS